MDAADSRIFETGETHFRHKNGFVKLSALDAAPTVVHVTLNRWPEFSAMEAHLAKKVGPVYLSPHYDTEMAELDIYSLSTPEALLRALGVNDGVLRAEVRRRSK